MEGFQSIVGHNDIIEYIKNAVKSDKVSHAYILQGERGAGKKLLSSLFAMTLQCERQQEEPCMECSSCKKIMNKNHPDVIPVTHEKPNSIGVEDIRIKLGNDMAVKPYTGPYKIYIVDEADKMTVQAQNALLKTLEEPPVYGVIFLLTENINSLLPTILSRCVVLKLKNVKDSLIKKYLMDVVKVPEYQADISTAFAQGNMGRAIMLASSEHFNEIRDEALQLLKYINDMEIYEIIDAVKNISKYKLEMNDYLDLIMVWYRDILMFKATRDAGGLVFSDEFNFISRQADKSSYEGLQNILEALEKAKVRLRANVNFDLTIELLLLTIKEN